MAIGKCEFESPIQSDVEKHWSGYGSTDADTHDDDLETIAGVLREDLADVENDVFEPSVTHEFRFRKSIQGLEAHLHELEEGLEGLEYQVRVRGDEILLQIIAPESLEDITQWMRAYCTLKGIPLDNRYHQQTDSVHGLSSKEQRVRKAREEIGNENGAIGEAEKQVRQLFAEGHLTLEIARRIEQTQKIPKKLWQTMGRLGLLGRMVPAKYGGPGGTEAGSIHIARCLGWICGSVALAVLANNDLAINRVLARGTEEQKRELLPQLCSGEIHAALSMTELEGGTTVSKWKKHTSEDGDGEELSFTGSKAYSTNGATATIFVVYGREKNGDLTAGIMNMEGVEIPVEELAQRDGASRSPQRPKRIAPGAQMADIFMNNAKAQKLGASGEGMEIMMRGLNVERASLAGAVVGAMETLEKIAIERTQRRFYGKEKYKVTEYLALIRGKVALAKAALERLAIQCDTGELTPQDADAILDEIVEDAHIVGQQTAEVCGADGFMGDDWVVQHILDILLYRVGGGALKRREQIAGSLIHGEEAPDFGFGRHIERFSTTGPLEYAYFGGRAVQDENQAAVRECAREKIKEANLGRYIHGYLQFTPKGRLRIGLKEKIRKRKGMDDEETRRDIIKDFGQILRSIGLHRMEGDIHADQ